MVRVGIIGIGFMGNTHFKIYKKNPKCQVVAISDEQKARLEGDWSTIVGNIGEAAMAQVNLRGTATYSRPEDLITRPDVDLVDICVPTNLHARYALQALEAGKHVFMEKPIAHTLDDAKSIVKAVRKSARKAAVGHCVRFWPEYAFLKQAVEENRFGRLWSLHLYRFSATPTWTYGNWMLDHERSGGGGLDLHIHDSDLVLYLFGKPKKVFSRASKGPSGGWDDISTTYIFDAPVKVTADGGWLGRPNFPFRMGYEAFFEEATVEYDMLKAKPLVVYAANGQVQIPAVEATDGWTVELNYFIDCIESNREPKTSTIEDARDSLALVLKEFESAASDKPVSV